MDRCRDFNCVDRDFFQTPIGGLNPQQTCNTPNHRITRSGSQFGLHPQSFCYTPQVENPGKKPDCINAKQLRPIRPACSSTPCTLPLWRESFTKRFIPDRNNWTILHSIFSGDPRTTYRGTHQLPILRTQTVSAHREPFEFGIIYSRQRARFDTLRLL
jgi:hypothetical protein